MLENYLKCHKTPSIILFKFSSKLHVKVLFFYNIDYCIYLFIDKSFILLWNIAQKQVLKYLNYFILSIR